MHERRLLSQEKRKKYANKNKSEHSFKINDFVLVKIHSKVLGVSPKLKPTYELVPYKILKINDFNAIVQSELDMTVNVRAVQDLKEIKTISNSDRVLQTLPKEAIELMQLVTTENLRTLF